MNADAVVVHGVDGNRMGVVPDLLAERIGQTREPARPHPQREVAQFRVAGADVRRVGPAPPRGAVRHRCARRGHSGLGRVHHRGF